MQRPSKTAESGAALCALMSTRPNLIDHECDVAALHEELGLKKYQRGRWNNFPRLPLPVLSKAIA
jgi:hypothetical protein